MTLFNRALWRKTIVESVILLAPCCVVVFGFSWLFVHLTGRLAIEHLSSFLQMIVPADLLKISSMDVRDWSTRRGLLSTIFVHPVIEFTCIIWALTRGSAAVSGEISRGTMEMLLAQPISRTSILFSNAATTIVGAAALSLATIGGLGTGLATAPLHAPTQQTSAGKSGTGIASFLPAPKPPVERERPAVQSFVPAAAILFCYTACLGGICTLVSSWGDYRYRTIGTIGIFGVLQVVFDVAVRWAEKGSPLQYLSWITIKTCFEPQRALFCSAEEFAPLMRNCCGTFAAITVASYLAAAIIFAKRDLPTPL